MDESERELMIAFVNKYRPVARRGSESFGLVWRKMQAEFPAYTADELFNVLVGRRVEFVFLDDGPV
ncbi:hypothetical protein HQ945_00960 [Phyllobacterium sp. BT25]|uniref:Uncharacterized protein n=1 Tax=Phyllobacterium pellucidum TaxID=2740464 RepID=A0A849VJ74_9HYPH|nr:hypothetical protein [Phyllobacterium pellucidum]NTS29811.1 hypothetical protein [Phyllobacterium pellucidum]